TRLAVGGALGSRGRAGPPGCAWHSGGAWRSGALGTRGALGAQGRLALGGALGARLPASEPASRRRRIAKKTRRRGRTTPTARLDERHHSDAPTPRCRSPPSPRAPLPFAAAAGSAVVRRPRGLRCPSPPPRAPLSSAAAAGSAVVRRRRGLRCRSPPPRAPRRSPPPRAPLSFAAAGVCHRTRRLARAHHPRLPSTVARIVALVGRCGYTSSRSPSVASATLKAVSETANAQPIEIAPLSTRLVPSGAVRVCAERMDLTDAQWQVVEPLIPKPVRRDDVEGAAARRRSRRARWHPLDHAYRCTVE